MWLVVNKDIHEPSVFEYSNENDARKKYEDLVKYYERKFGDSDWFKRIYLVKVLEYRGTLKGHVD